MKYRVLSPLEATLSLSLRLLPIKHGKHRILDKLVPAAWHKGDSPILIPIGNASVLVDPRDLVGWHFAILRSFDPEVVEVLCSACDQDVDNVLWDIGANKAVCSIALAASVPGLHLVAIEPQAALRACNIWNLDRVCPGRYEYVAAGLGEQPEELELVVPQDNLGKASFHLAHGGRDCKHETVLMKTAEQIRSESAYDWPTIAKIDVEGHEPSVFRSLDAAFSNGSLRAVVFENHPGETAAFHDISSLANQYGYRLFGIAKSPWRTRLAPTDEQLDAVLDYAVLREDVAAQNSRIRKMMR